jgi:hypothetical protein
MEQVMKINWAAAQTILGTWGRAFTAAILASYMSGFHDPKYLINAGLAAILPVVLRWMNPKDSFPTPPSTH